MSEIKDHQITSIAATKISDPENVPIIATQITDGTIVKRMYVTVQIAINADIDLPSGFDTVTNKFLVFVNGELTPAFATSLAADVIFKGTATNQIMSSSIIAAGSVITLVKIPGLITGSALFTDTATANVWV